jgi:hypothetical protein
LELSARERLDPEGLSLSLRKSASDQGGEKSGRCKEIHYSVPGRPDEFVKKSPRTWTTNPLFVKGNNTYIGT